MRANLIILSKIKDEVGGFSIEIPRFNVFFFIFLLIDAKFQLIFQAVSVELCPCYY